MRRIAVGSLALAVLLVLLVSAIAPAAPAPKGGNGPKAAAHAKVIEVRGSGVVPLADGGTARVTVQARSWGNEYSGDPEPHWGTGTKATGLFIIQIAGGPKLIGRVTEMTTGWEIARGVFFHVLIDGATYYPYITEDYDLSGDGVWFKVPGYETAGGPADISSGDFRLDYLPFPAG